MDELDLADGRAFLGSEVDVGNGIPELAAVQGNVLGTPEIWLSSSQVLGDSRPVPIPGESETTQEFEPSVSSDLGFGDLSFDHADTGSPRS